MAQLLQAFDASQVKPDQGIGGLPVGKYPVVIQSSEVKPTKGNDGGLVEFVLSVTDGEHKGSIGAYRINLYNANAQAVEIARKQLSALCHVTGVFMLQDTSQLHGIPFVVEVALQKGEEAQKQGYTEVKRVFDMQGNEPGKQGASQPQQQAQQSNPVGGFGSNAPQGQGAAWGGQAQQQQPAQAQQQQPQGGNAWGQQPLQNQGQNQAQGGWNQQQSNQQQQPAQTGWQQNNGGNAGAAPWGQR